MILVTRRIKWKLFLLEKKGKVKTRASFFNLDLIHKIITENMKQIYRKTNKSHVIQNIYEATYKNVIIHCRVLLQEPKTWKWCKKKIPEISKCKICKVLKHKIVLNFDKWIPLVNQLFMGQTHVLSRAIYSNIYNQLYSIDEIFK